MTYVLGLNIYNADASDCLFNKKELKIAIEEERFTRIKHFADFFLRTNMNILVLENFY